MTCSPATRFSRAGLRSRSGPVCRLRNRDGDRGARIVPWRADGRSRHAIPKPSRGFASKLSTFRDGFRILRTIVILFQEEKPLAFFAGVSAVLAAVSVGLALPVIIEYMDTGLVPRQPTALLATGVMLSALLSLVCGVVLESVKRGQREIKRLFYLQAPER